MSLINQYAELRARRDALKAELDDVNKRIETLGDACQIEFAENGIDSMRCAHGTLYVARTLWAGAVQVEGADGKTHGDAERTAEALRRAGLEWMVKPSFNVQTLSAWVREQPRDEQGEIILPDALKGNISITEKPEIRLRKAKEKVT